MEATLNAVMGIGGLNVKLHCAVAKLKGHMQGKLSNYNVLPHQHTTNLPK